MMYKKYAYLFLLVISLTQALHIQSMQHDIEDYEDLFKNILPIFSMDTPSDLRAIPTTTHTIIPETRKRPLQQTHQRRSRNKQAHETKVPCPKCGKKVSASYVALHTAKYCWVTKNKFVIKKYHCPYTHTDGTPCKYIGTSPSEISSHRRKKHFEETLHTLACTFQIRGCPMQLKNRQARTNHERVCRFNPKNNDKTP